MAALRDLLHALPRSVFCTQPRQENSGLAISKTVADSLYRLPGIAVISAIAGVILNGKQGLRSSQGTLSAGSPNSVDHPLSGDVRNPVRAFCAFPRVVSSQCDRKTQESLLQEIFVINIFTTIVPRQTFDQFDVLGNIFVSIHRCQPKMTITNNIY